MPSLAGRGAKADRLLEVRHVLREAALEAAALYAFASARNKPVICFAYVANQMARVEGDFEKGEADGAVDALRIVATAACACLR
jgi:uridine phosphorylase